MEIKEEYLRGAKGGFEESEQPCAIIKTAKKPGSACYRIPQPGLLWDSSEHDPLPADGGQKRPQTSVKAAFAPFVEQMQALANELFVIRERAHDHEYVGEQIKRLPGRLRNFKRQLFERMASFERKLSGQTDPDWIEDGLERFEMIAWEHLLSAELLALREALDETHSGLSRQLRDFQNEVDARVKTFAAAIRGKAS